MAKTLWERTLLLRKQPLTALWSSLLRGAQARDLGAGDPSRGQGVEGDRAKEGREDRLTKGRGGLGTECRGEKQDGQASRRDLHGAGQQRV